MTLMTAALYDAYGGPDKLYRGETAVPMRQAGKVLVRVHAASVNGIDLIVRAGTLRLLSRDAFPRRTGLDFAGEVVDAGTSAQFAAGDRVWGAMPHGEYGSVAEYVAVLPEQLSHSPTGLDLVTAAALPAVGSTAIIALRDIGCLQAGQKLLVRGASGGVGCVAVQLGRSMGAHVTALANAASLDFVRTLGADAAFDYRATAPSGLGKFDVIVDTVGSQTSAFRRLLAANGRMTTICPDPRRPLASILYTVTSWVYGDRRVRFFSAKPKTPLLAALAAYVERGAIRPIVDRVWPMARIGDAHRAMEAGGCRGKQVIRVEHA